MCAYLTLVLAHGLGEGLIGRPRHDLIIVERIGHAQDVSAAVLRVVVHTFGCQVTAAASLKVNPQGAHLRTQRRFSILCSQHNQLRSGAPDLHRTLKRTIRIAHVA